MNNRNGVRAETRHALEMHLHNAHDAAALERAIAAKVGLPDDHLLFYERYTALAQTTMGYVLRGVPTDWILTDLRSGGER